MFKIQRLNIFKHLIFLALLITNLAFGNNPCFEEVIEAALNNSKNIEHFELEKCKSLFLNGKSPLENPENTKNWLRHLISKNEVDQATAKKLADIPELVSSLDRRKSLMSRLMKSPHNLNEIEASNLTELLIESYVRQNLGTRGIWDIERMQEHVFKVTLKKEGKYIAGGGHRYQSYDEFLKNIYNPQHPGQELSILEIGAKAPSADEFKSGQFIVEKLPNGVERVYIPAKAMFKPSVNTSQMQSGSSGSFFKAAVPGVSDVYKGKSTFPRNWTEADILEAQKFVLKNPTKVTLKVNEIGEAADIVYQGTYIKDGKEIKIIIGGYEYNGKLNLSTMYPDWNQ